MTILDKYRDERDAHGDLTTLAIAIDALERGECDCASDDPPCVVCVSYEALVEVVKQRDHYERLADELNQQIGGMK